MVGPGGPGQGVAPSVWEATSVPHWVLHMWDGRGLTVSIRARGMEEGHGPGLGATPIG